MNMRGVSIKAVDAVVSKAEVDIDIIRIGTKQMTLAVFRQLWRDDDITGQMWGLVNYHPDRCADQKEHLHIVWQKEKELRRATLYIQGVTDKASYIPNMADPGAGWVCAAVLDEWKPEKWPTSYFMDVDYDEKSQVLFRSDLWESAEKLISYGYHSYYKKKCEEIAQGKTKEQHWRDMAGIIELLKQKRERRINAYIASQNLRQLFIAV